LPYGNIRMIDPTRRAVGEAAISTYFNALDLTQTQSKPQTHDIPAMRREALPTEWQER
jgi:hypothetical protein